MLQIYSTDNGTGASIYGDYGDLKNLYDTVAEIASSLDESNIYQRGQHQLLMNFSYEIRKGLMGERLNEKIEFVGDDKKYEYYGFQLVWTDILIFISALRCNAGYTRTNKLHQATLYMLEYTVERALYEYDEAGAALIKDYIAQRINVFNKYSFLIYQTIHIRFVTDKPGKIRFRKIPQILGTHFSEWTDEYKDLIKSFEKSAKEQNCDIADLEITEFPDIKW